MESRIWAYHLGSSIHCHLQFLSICGVKAPFAQQTQEFRSCSADPPLNDGNCLAMTLHLHRFASLHDPI